MGFAYYHAGGIWMKNNNEISCNVELTEGAIDRITDAFVDIYYGIRNGTSKGPLPDNEKEG